MMVYNAIPTTMQVPYFVGSGTIRFIDKLVPEPGPGQLLIKVKANALCGSERDQFFGGAPVTSGHETAGVVVAAGPETRTAISTPGVIFLMDFCGACRSCRRGCTNQCLAKRGDMGFNRDGGYGVYELVHENIFFPIPPDVPLTEATLLLDSMGTSGHALGRARLIRSDIESLVVTGAGPIGLGVLAMAKVVLGPDIPVLIADVIDYRLDLARRLGGEPIHLKQTTLEAGLRMHGLDSVDVAIDTSGRTVARRACIDVLGQRGVLVCVGHGEALHLTVSPDLIATERAILGSEYFRYDELPTNLQFLRTHLPYLQQIITHRYALHEIQHAFHTFFAGDTGKVVIEQ